MHTTDGVWLSITDYSSYKKVSISTIRRHIKSNLLKYREENGKYFIYVPSAERIRVREDEVLLKVRLENELLKTQVRQLREENNELRMLVDIYEKQTKLSRVETPPELPQIL
jgi:hypothetical protein